MNEEKRPKYIKEGVLKGRTRLPYEQYVKERAIYWLEEIATKEELEEARNKINYTLYELDELQKLNEDAQTYRKNSEAHSK